VKEFNQARVNGGSNYDSQPLREAIVGYNVSVHIVLCLLVDLVKFNSLRLIKSNELSVVVGDQRQHNLVRGNP